MPSLGYTNPSSPPPPVSGGKWQWVGDALNGVWQFAKSNAGDILGAVGSGIEAYMSSEDRAKQLAQQKAEFDANLKQRQAEAATSSGQYDKSLEQRRAEQSASEGQFGRTTGNAEAQAAVRAQTQLNAAPLADKGQALLLARMGASPGAFKPRDYTQGTSQISRPFTAPGASVAESMQRSAANYKAGDGGVDTSTIKMLLDKMQGSAFAPQGPATAPTPPTPTGSGSIPTTPIGGHPRLPGGTPPLNPPRGGLRPPTDPTMPEATDPLTARRLLLNRMQRT